ncbi:hypothetical protein DO97_01790 [Neosynechococcus sphagnicola sy1]|uniref:DUF732 domain-containing protein n=1 Tax=Neosynechococcus sphagnicola sy1 TaxID=1497020 RepID=A0A098TLC3_9CYAN|nr:hypothetical protein [Neosynechococcus sphagnicola]KGF73099.1 hypothetical protein DO97_01790 [Neosynechococcus sphagnicola sy1]
MNRVIYGGLSALVLTATTAVLPLFTPAADAQTNPIKACITELMSVNSPIVSGGQRAQMTDLAAATICQNATKPGFSVQKAKQCMKELMYVQRADGEILEPSGISDIAAATACRGAV